VELRDIMPTLLDAAGVSVPPTAEGASLLPSARGKQTEWREYVHGEHAAKERSHHYVTDGKEKYIWFSQTGEEQLFDLRCDPRERACLSESPAHQERLRFWRGKLVQELAGREEGYSDGKRLVIGCKPQMVLRHIQT
jgi:arylsulfatase